MDRPSIGSSSSSSFFEDLRIRELNGFRVRKRPYLGDLSSESGATGAGVLSVEHNGNFAPPLAISFAKTNGSSNLLAVSDEDGYVSFYDTRRRLPSFNSSREKQSEARVCDWIAHNNAIFDVCWMKDDSQILSASGDQTIKVWNAETATCVGVLSGHIGSVKSLCSHASNPDLLVSGSRDGSFALWDLRCKSVSTNSCGEPYILSTSLVNKAHASVCGKRVKRGKVASMSVTSVLYLKDEISIASSCAMDNVIKFWDTRNLKASIAQASPRPEPSNTKEKVLHGISCLSQDSNGVYLAASCMDHRIYFYDVLRLSNGPAKIFSGSKIESFYVKSAISPDGTHILGGSSDGNAYIWRVQKPESEPITLKGHEGEVTAVDWCSSDYGKLATSSDDFMVRVWNFKDGSSISTRSPNAIRKRVTADPSFEYSQPARSKKLIMEDAPPQSGSSQMSDNPYDSKETHLDPSSPIQTEVVEFGTPESSKKRLGGFLLKSPEGASDSPSSVLNPPSSLKRRTIRDYFASFHGNSELSRPTV